MNFISTYRPQIAVLAAITVITASIALSVSSIVDDYPELYIGIIYDLTFTSPLIYLALIWKTRIPKITTVPVFVIGYLIASYIIPDAQSANLKYIEFIVLPLLELTIITLVIIKVRKTIVLTRKNLEANVEFYSSLKSSSIEILKNEKLGKVVATEIAMIYYGLITWRKSKPGNDHFTGYKESGVVAIFITLIFLVITETFIVHILLLKWNSMVAWIVFALSIYAGVQLLGHTKSLMRRFTEINGHNLILRYGLFGDATIDVKNIEDISLVKGEPEGKHIKKLAMLGGLERQNVQIQLTNPVSVESIYGMRKSYSSIMVYIDNPEDLIDRVRELQTEELDLH